MINQQIEEIFVERPLIVRQEIIARKNYKIGNWLKLLSLHRQNQDFKAYRDVICLEMHENFIMHSNFWKEQVLASTFNKAEINRDDIDFVMLALDDGPYCEIATLIADKIVNLFLQKQLRLNYCLSILEKCITIFSYCSKVSFFFKCLRKIYKQAESTIKIRSTYDRQIRLANDNFDAIWDEYKIWQADRQILDSKKHHYQVAKTLWQKKSVDFDENICSLANIKQSLYNLEDVNERLIDQKQYIFYLEKLPTQTQKLWFLRRVVLNYRQMMQPYLLKLQCLHRNDQEILIKKYKVVIRLSVNDSLIQMRYLHFLGRRINRHLLSEPLPEEYNQTWPEKVGFFRSEISEMIQKPRVGTSQTDKNHIVTSLYQLWLQIEEKIVRDKDSTCQLFQTILKQSKQLQLYEDYANKLINFGAIGDAKNILRRYMHHASSYHSKQAYLRFISLYGTVQDQVEFLKEGNVGGNQDKVINTVAAVEGQESSQTPKVVSKSNIAKQVEAQPQKTWKRQRQQVKDEVGEKILESTRKKLHIDSDSTVYLKGMPVQWQQSDVLDHLKCKEKVKQIRFPDQNSKAKDYCYIEFESKEAAEQELKHEHKGLQLHLSKPPSGYDEGSTLFLCALPKTTTDQKIRNFFKQAATSITDIRLKIDKDKNYAYVEFDTAESKNTSFEAVKSQRMAIDGKNILVQLCDSSRAKNKKFIPVVFIKNLAFKAKQSDLRQFFTGKTISKLHIPLTVEKRSQGFAYVEFQKFGDFQEALDMKTGKIFGREFQILRSDRSITQPHKVNDKRQERPSQSHRKEHHSRRGGKDRAAKQEDSSKRDNNYFSNLFK